jgi:hypothetical protein
MQKRPQQNRRKRSGPPATPRLPTAPHLAGHHTTTGEQSHLEGMASRKPAGHRSGGGVPYTYRARTGRRNARRLKPPGRAPGTKPTTAPSAATKNSSTTKEPEEAEEKKSTAGKNSTGRRGQTRGASEQQPSPRHHGRPGRGPHRAPPLPPFLATTARQEQGAAENQGHHGQLLRRLLEAPARRRQVVELQRS